MADQVTGTFLSVGRTGPDEPPPEGKVWVCLAVPLEEARTLPLYGEVALVPVKKPTQAQQAARRPSNYNQLSAREQWNIDKRLRLLDWDGE